MPSKVDSCDGNNFIFSPNDDGSFDIVFNNFRAATNPHDRRVSATCHLQIPLVVPEGYQLSLKSVSIAGITDVKGNGLSKASITHFFNSGRESTDAKTFRGANNTQDVIVDSRVDDNYTRCDQDREALVETKIEIFAKRGRNQNSETSIAISEAAGQRKARYRLDYKRCGGNPDCGRDSILVNGQCKPLAQRCSDYNNTNVEVCNNPKDTLQCDYVPSTKECVSKCPHDHFSMDGQCFKKAQNCSEYNFKGGKVCNNGEDSLMCDYNDGSRQCFPERRR